MLSEGRPGVDHVFSFCEGILRLEVDKPTFERMGLDGKPIPTAGRKHVKARYGKSNSIRTGFLGAHVQSSDSAQSETPVNGQREERFSANCLGFPKRLEPQLKMAFLRHQRSE